MKKIFFWSFMGAAGLAFLAMSGTRALADDFYAGKTIRFIVGFAAGGGYDTYTRTIARYLGKHIPGNPEAVVENMDGAGSLIAANYLYNRAEPDGLTIGVWNSGLVLQQALDARGVQFEANKFGWIGAPVAGLPTCAVMGFTGLKTLDDVIKSKKPIKMGATRAGSTTDDLPRILNLTLGTNFEVIAGYRGTARIRLAMQKREVDGACWGWESMRVTGRSMLDAKGEDKLIPYVIHGQVEDPEVKALPQITKVIKGDKNLSIFTTWVRQYDFQRPLSVSPGTPNERLAILRRAFDSTFKDSEFLADAKASKLILEHVTGKEIEGYVGDILGTPPKVKESLEFLVKKAKVN